MKNHETGEFELALGNRQLLSGFFIVVILFGVFFVMGYIVGRNSTPSARVASAEAAVNAAAVPAAAEARPQSAAGAVAPVEQAAATPTATTTAGANAPGAAPSDPATPAAAPAGAAETAAKQEAPPDDLIEPVPGDTYLQVMSVKRPDAEVIKKTLRDKGFRSVLEAGPNGLVRVLVGPFPDTGALGQAKAGLENAGFHPIVRK
jgi:cell division septation protein DedD